MNSGLLWASSKGVAQCLRFKKRLLDPHYVVLAFYFLSNFNRSAAFCTKDGSK